MNFYKRYLGDYARDTAHLSLTEHGVYTVLLDTYYATNGRLPAEREELYRIARAMTPIERKAVEKVADQFFAVNGDGARHNKRADEELIAYNTQAGTNRRIAEERERKRREAAALNDSPDDPIHESEYECEHEPSTNRSTNDQPKPEARIQKERTTPLPPSGAFARFWLAWPRSSRKAAQGKCAELWRTRNLDVKADEILAHVEAMKRSDDWQRGYVPAPFVYLRNARWEGADLTDIPKSAEERFPI